MADIDALNRERFLKLLATSAGQKGGVTAAPAQAPSAAPAPTPAPAPAAGARRDERRLPRGKRSKPMVQLNVRVLESVRDFVSAEARRENQSIAEYVVAAVDAYAVQHHARHQPDYNTFGIPYHAPSLSEPSARGAGIDYFVFNSTLGATNIDQITDFLVVDDTIRLENTGTGLFTAFTATGVISTTAFWIGNAAHLATDRIIYNSANGDVLYDSDGTGAAAAVKFATRLRALPLRTWTLS